MALSDYLILAGVLLFVAGEIAALDGPGLTLSERLRIWTGRALWRRLALLAVLALTYTHIAYGWPW